MQIQYNYVTLNWALFLENVLPNVMFLYNYFTHGCKIVKAPMSMFCLATIYRQREILYKSVSDIPVCTRLAAKVWLVWS